MGQQKARSICEEELFEIYNRVGKPLFRRNALFLVRNLLMMLPRLFPEEDRQIGECVLESPTTIYELEIV